MTESTSIKAHGMALLSRALENVSEVREDVLCLSPSDSEYGQFVEAERLIQDLVIALALVDINVDVESWLREE